LTATVSCRRSSRYPSSSAIISSLNRKHRANSRPLASGLQQIRGFPDLYRV
jgi:hypothetical protein